MRTLSSWSPSMMSSAPRPVIESLPAPPSRMSPSPKTGPVTGQKPAAEFAMTVAELSVRGCGTIALSPAMRFDAGLVEHVAAGEAGPAETCSGRPSCP